MTKHDEVTGLRQELKGLEAATARQGPPLSPYTMGIAQPKIAKLQRQIKELEEALAHAGRPPDLGRSV